MMPLLYRKLLTLFLCCTNKVSTTNVAVTDFEHYEKGSLYFVPTNINCTDSFGSRKGCIVNCFSVSCFGFSYNTTTRRCTLCDWTDQPSGVDYGINPEEFFVKYADIPQAQRPLESTYSLGSYYLESTDLK